ncbi:MAG: integrase [Psychroserpens sp.]|jgi:integrase
MSDYELMNLWIDLKNSAIESASIKEKISVAKQIDHLFKVGLKFFPNLFLDDSKAPSRRKFEPSIKNIHMKLSADLSPSAFVFVSRFLANGILRLIDDGFDLPQPNVVLWRRVKGSNINKNSQAEKSNLDIMERNFGEGLLFDEMDVSEKIGLIFYLLVRFSGYSRMAVIKQAIESLASLDSRFIKYESVKSLKHDAIRGFCLNPKTSSHETFYFDCLTEMFITRLFSDHDFFKSFIEFSKDYDDKRLEESFDKFQILLVNKVCYSSLQSFFDAISQLHLHIFSMHCNLIQRAEVVSSDLNIEVYNSKLLIPSVYRYRRDLIAKESISLSDESFILFLKKHASSDVTIHSESFTFSHAQHVVFSIVKLASSYRGHYFYLAEKLLAIICEKNIDQVKTKDIEGIYVDFILSSKGLARDHVLKSCQSFHQFLVDDYGLNPIVINDENIFGIKLRIGFKSSAYVVTPSEYEAALVILLKASNDSSMSVDKRYEQDCQTLALILGYRAGLRGSEILGLKVNDIDCHIRLNHNEYRKLKSKAAVRKIPVEPFFTDVEADILKKFKEKWRSGDNCSEYLFFSRGSESLMARHRIFPLISALLSEICRYKVRFHHLRHSFCTYTYLRLSKYASFGRYYPRRWSGRGDKHYDDICFKNIQAYYCNSHTQGLEKIEILAGLSGHVNPGTTLEYYVHSAKWLAKLELDDALPTYQPQFFKKTFGLSGVAISQHSSSKNKTCDPRDLAPILKKGRVEIDRSKRIKTTAESKTNVVYLTECSLYREFIRLDEFFRRADNRPEIDIFGNTITHTHLVDIISAVRLEVGESIYWRLPKSINSSITGKPRFISALDEERFIDFFSQLEDLRRAKESEIIASFLEYINSKSKRLEFSDVCSLQKWIDILKSLGIQSADLVQWVQYPPAPDKSPIKVLKTLYPDTKFDMKRTRLETKTQPPFKISIFPGKFFDSSSSKCKRDECFFDVMFMMILKLRIEQFSVADYTRDLEDFW